MAAHVHPSLANSPATSTKAALLVKHHISAIDEAI